MVESRSTRDLPAGPEVVCFGMIIPAIVLVVDRVPEHNTGMHILDAAEFISDDAAIVAGVLRGWQVRSGLIGTTLGDDARGRAAVRELKRLGVLGHVRLSKRVRTPYEVNVSDRTGHRTYYWQRDPKVLTTLKTAPLGMLTRAKMLYVDWYDGDQILRPMIIAHKRGIPVFLNLEHGHSDPGTLARFAPFASICQAVTAPAQRAGDPIATAKTLLTAGIQTAVVTMASAGCIAARAGEMLRVSAPQVQVVDGCGAGATFSAGIIYGTTRGWNLEDTLRFATAAASLKCTVVGPRAFPIRQVKRLAQTVQVQKMGTAF